jgi:hypothetical protein
MWQSCRYTHNGSPTYLLRCPVENSNLIAGFHRQRFAILCGAGVGVLSAFLPWVSFGGFTASGVDDWEGWLVIALFLPGIVLALMGTKTAALVENARLGVSIPAGLAALFGAYKLIRIQSSVRDFNSALRDGPRIGDMPKDNPFGPLIDAMNSSIHAGVGLYLVVLAGIAVAVLTWLLAKPTQAP